MKKTMAYYTIALKGDLEESCRDLLKHYDITRSQFYYLLYIVEHKNCTPGQLAQELGADAGHTTRTLDKLVASNCVSRCRDTNDRRSVVLQATSKGEEFYEKTKQAFITWDSEMLAPLSESEREQFTQMLERVVQAHGKK